MSEKSVTMVIFKIKLPTIFAISVFGAFPLLGAFFTVAFFPGAFFLGAFFTGAFYTSALFPGAFYTGAFSEIHHLKYPDFVTKIQTYTDRKRDIRTDCFVQYLGYCKNAWENTKSS